MNKLVMCNTRQLQCITGIDCISETCNILLHSVMEWIKLAAQSSLHFTFPSVI